MKRYFKDLIYMMCFKNLLLNKMNNTFKVTFYSPSVVKKSLDD